MNAFRLNPDNLFQSKRSDKTDASRSTRRVRSHSVSEGHLNDANGTVRKEESYHETALHQAATVGDVERVKRLISNGAKVNASDLVGRTPLYQAATEGHVEVVKLLLKNGAHPDGQEETRGNTPLHQAAWQGYSQTLEALCHAGKANIYVKNKTGFTALHLACQNGHNQSCRVLLWSGCKPDLKNNYGDTPTHTAARYGHAGVMRILLSAFANVNELNRNGDTALHIAAAMNWRKLTKILLESRCDPIIKNRQGETARDIASRKEYHEVVGIIDNPPPLLPLPKAAQAKDGTKPTVTGRKDPKKPPDKDSGTSLGGRDSEFQKSFNEKLRKKGGTAKTGNRVRFSGDEKKFTCPGKNSPYGCPTQPNMATFPQPKLDTLPPEPLSKGEQYFVDLAGNIRKGAIGVGTTCYCGPRLQQIEKTMKVNKEELMEEIDTQCQNLKTRINHLERRTKHRLSLLNQTVKEKLAEERSECVDRVERRAVRERQEFEKQQEAQAEVFRTDMKTYVDRRIKDHATDFARRSRKEKMSEASMYIMKARSEILLTDNESNAALYNSWPLVPANPENRQLMLMPKLSQSGDQLSNHRSHTLEEFL